MHNKFKDNYHNLVESLKRHQRAELLNDCDEDLIEELYTDPYEGNSVLNAMLNDQTTLLIGRKGSGKSTIINRFQHEIRKAKNKISLYIDVRTIYSKSKNSSEVSDENVFTLEEQTRYSIYQNFISKIIEEIKDEISKNIFEKNKSFKQKFINLFKNKEPITEQDFIQELDSILKKTINGNYKDITKIKTLSIDHNQSQSETDEKSIEVKLSATPAILGKTLKEDTSLISDASKFSQILKKEFEIVNFAEKIKKLLQKIEIRKIFICLDDCSELDQEALDMFVRTIVAPLHNDSDGFFRFKIAFYPERNTLPDIDRSKIDTYMLDYYHLYKSSGADKVEEQAISYVKRLIRQRIKHYFNESNVSDIESTLFDTKSMSIDDYYKLIFYIASSIPRNIGKVLFYAERKSISQGKPITKTVLQESSEEQYENDISPILTKDEFFQYKSYGENFKRSQLLSLMNKIIEKAKENKQKIGTSNSNIFKDYTTSNAPSHYLFIKRENELFLSTLEINFFITRISEQKDKGDYKNNKFISNDIIVYTINYGLCQKENIIYDEPNNRKYRIERLFDYNKLIEEWVNNSAIVKCTKCGFEYEMSEWETIKDFNCLCRKCNTLQSCELIMGYKNKPNAFKEEKIQKRGGLGNEQLRIIHSLYIENNLSESLIASELDVSQETIRAYLREDRILRKEAYVIKNDDKTYNLTDKARTFCNDVKYTTIK